MASFDSAAQTLALRFLLCGPARAGKSEVLARLRERLGSRDGEEARDLLALPVALPGGATLRIELFELDPIDESSAAAELLMRSADGVCYVADPRRERLRDNLMAYAWVLERLRVAGRSELPGVLLLNRRDGGDLVGAAELESVIGSGRFPSFTTDAMRGEEVARTLLELMRRGAHRAHVELALDQRGLALPALLLALDEAISRPAMVATPVEPVVEPSAPSTPSAPSRSPILRYVRRLLLEQSAHARERRRMAEQASLVEDEARRPLQFLRSLFTHLDRQAPRLPPTLEEAVAGGAEVLDHLEALLARRSRASLASAGATAGRTVDVGLMARQALRAAAGELPDRRLRLACEGVGRCTGEPDLMRALLWSLIVASVRSRVPRREIVTVVRVRGVTDGRSLRLRIGRFGRIGRGRGIEELALARRLARRLGWRLEFAIRRGGACDLRLEPRSVVIDRLRPVAPRA